MPEIRRIDIQQLVRVRKYEIDCAKLKKLLREHKKLVGKSNKALAEALDVPVTMAEHWFRTDSGFSIPDAEVWDNLKMELAITSTEFDESITTFEERPGVYERAERCYFAEGVAPTLTSTMSGKEKIIVEERKMQETKQRIRKLTPKECFRLMDFDDADYEKAATVNNNAQLYKQAGNSIVVAVPKFIIAQLLECGALVI